MLPLTIRAKTKLCERGQWGGIWHHY